MHWKSTSSKTHLAKGVVTPDGGIVGKNFDHKKLHPGDVGITVRLDRRIQPEEMTPAQMNAAIAVLRKMSEEALEQLGSVPLGFAPGTVIIFEDVRSGDSCYGFIDADRGDFLRIRYYTSPGVLVRKSISLNNFSIEEVAMPPGCSWTHEEGLILALAMAMNEEYWLDFEYIARKFKANQRLLIESALHADSRKVLRSFISLIDPGKFSADLARIAHYGGLIRNCLTGDRQKIIDLLHGTDAIHLIMLDPHHSCHIEAYRAFDAAESPELFVEIMIEAYKGCEDFIWSPADIMRALDAIPEKHINVLRKIYENGEIPEELCAIAFNYIRREQYGDPHCPSRKRYNHEMMLDTFYEYFKKDEDEQES